MDWSLSMGKLISVLLGIPSDAPKKRKFEIKPKMVTPTVVRMDVKSFRKSKAVKEQAEAASKAKKQVTKSN